MRLRIVKHFFFIIVCSFAHPCLAQDFVYENYAIPEGLPSSETYDLYQDSKGFIWIASDNGVTRFDGKEMTNYNLKDGLSDPVVFGFSEDSKGRIWFRTFSGQIYYYNNGKIHTYKFNDNIEKVCKAIMSNLYCDEHDKIWFSSGINLVSIDSTGTTTVSKKITPFQFKYESIDHKYSFTTYYGPTQLIKHGIFGDKIFSLHLSDTIHNNPIILSVQHDHNIYLTVNTNIFKYDGKTLQKMYTGPSSIVSFTKDKDNNFWVGCMSNGITRYKDDSFSNPFSLNFLAKKTISKTLQDHEGGFWFATLESGVYYVPNLSIEKYPLPLQAKITRVVHNDESIIIGDRLGDVSLLDPVTKKITKKKSVGEPIVTLFNDKNNTLWVSATTGVALYDKNLNLKKPQSDNKICLVDFTTDSQGFIWAVGGNRVVKFKDTGDSVLFKRASVYYRTILVKDSVIYLTTLNRLQMKDTTLHSIPTPEKLKAYKISKPFPLNDSILFIPAMGSGYLLLNHNTQAFKEYNTTNNFIADNIYLCRKVDSTLWLSTEKGIIIVNIQSILNGKPTFKLITKKSGLPSEKLNALIYFNNAMYMFSDENLSVLPISNLNFTFTEPRFYSKKMTVNDQSLDHYQTENLKYNENNLEFEFGFIAFNNQTISIRYRLNEQKPWVYTSNRNLLFTSLAPDHYHFELSYSVDNIHWLNATTVSFNINAPWWERWYFQFSVFFFLLFLGYWYYKNRLAQFRQKHYYLKVINEHQHKLIQSEIETMERERSRIAKELHDGVGTNLTAIKLRVGQLLKKHNEPVAFDVEDQLQLTIKEIKDIIYGLTPSGLERYGLFASLKDYTERLNTTIQTKIDLNIFGEEINKPEISLLIFRVIQELISNSIKHAQAKNITIHINSFDDLFSIVYEDDGIGFSYNAIKNGLGLNNIESRIQSVDGKLTFESGGFGVSYTIDIPLLKT